MTLLRQGFGGHGPLATIQHGRTVLVPASRPAPVLPAARTRPEGSYSSRPLGDGRVELFNPQGEPCGICTSQGLADQTLRLLNP